MGTRLNKFLASCGWSRRAADRLIEQGRVTVDGAVAMLGTVLKGHEEVLVDGKRPVPEQGTVAIALNKPVGVITTASPESRNTVMELVPSDVRLFPVGRLDVASSGLIILTNDGALAQRLSHPRYGHEREYLVGVQKPISDEDLARLAGGVRLADGMTAPAMVRRVAPNAFVIVLTEGRNRQVRRMCEEVGHDVRSLRRTRIGGLLLGDLPAGEWRKLTAAEIRSLSVRPRDDGGKKNRRRDRRR